MRALLMSGGLDSAALAWMYRPELCVTINYGQRAAEGELIASAALCSHMGLEHLVLAVDHSSIGSGNMSNQAPVKEAQAPEFWPYRNQCLVTLAAMALASRGLSELMIGIVSTDVHADGSAEFVETLDRLLRLQEGGVRLLAPARDLSGVELLKRAAFPRELIGLTFSCHTHRYACGQCGGCTKHYETVDEVYGPVAQATG